MKTRRTVDSAHLLRKHDGRSTVVGTSDSGNTEAIPHSGEVASASSFLEFLLINDIRVVVVAGRDDGVRAELAHRLKALGNLSVLHEPTGRLGAEEDTDSENERGDEGGTELKTPGNFASVLDDDVGAETEEDTCEMKL